MSRDKQPTALPPVSFIGVGVNKCGSSWLFKCLKEHPALCLSHKRETAFFDRVFFRGLNWYANQFNHCRPEQLCGEFTPSYVDNRETIERIHRYYPNAKLLLILRDPLDRLRSHWKFDYNRGRHNHTSFETYLKHAPLCDWKKGLYAEKLSLLLEFYPRERIHTIIFDDIKNNPQQVVSGVYAYLGIDPNVTPPSLREKVNASQHIATRVRWINNFIFWTRTLKDKSRLGGVFTALFKRLGGTRLTNYLLRRNIKQTTQPQQLDASLSSEATKRVRDFYATDLERLKDTWDIPVPPEWKR